VRNDCWSVPGRLCAECDGAQFVRRSWMARLDRVRLQLNIVLMCCVCSLDRPTDPLIDRIRMRSLDRLIDRTNERIYDLRNGAGETFARAARLVINAGADTRRKMGANGRKYNYANERLPSRSRLSLLSTLFVSHFPPLVVSYRRSTDVCSSCSRSTRSPDSSMSSSRRSCRRNNNKQPGFFRTLWCVFVARCSLRFVSVSFFSLNLQRRDDVVVAVVPHVQHAERRFHLLKLTPQSRRTNKQNRNDKPKTTIERDSDTLDLRGERGVVPLVADADEARVARLEHRPAHQKP
jgi:hypothetical protein